MILVMVDRIGPRHPARVYAREWMASRDLTQKQLAGRMGCAEGTISKLFNGKMDWTPEYLGDAADALGIDPGDLFRDPARPTQADLLRDLPEEKRAFVIEMIKGLRAG